VADILWGSTPMITFFISDSCTPRTDRETARWAVLLRAGQTPLEPHLVTVTGGPQSR
jgi:hypothetical protein